MSLRRRVLVAAAALALMLSVARAGESPVPSSAAGPSPDSDCLTAPAAMQSLLAVLSEFTRRGGAQGVLRCIDSKLSTVYGQVTANGCWNDARYAQYIGKEIGLCVFQQQSEAGAASDAHNSASSPSVRNNQAAYGQLANSAVGSVGRRELVPGPQASHPRAVRVRALPAAVTRQKSSAKNSSERKPSPTAQQAPGRLRPSAVQTAPTRAATVAQTTPARAATVAPAVTTIAPATAQETWGGSACTACSYCCVLKSYLSKDATYLCMLQNSCFCNC